MSTLERMLARELELWGGGAGLFRDGAGGLVATGDSLEGREPELAAVGQHKEADIRYDGSIITW